MHLTDEEVLTIKEFLQIHSAMAEKAKAYAESCDDEACRSLFRRQGERISDHSRELMVFLRAEMIPPQMI